MGQATRDSACAIDMILNELRNNYIEIDKETLSFHIHACLREHEDIYGAVINQLDILPFSLSNIYEQMNRNNFGRLIAYLTLVYKIADSLDEETTRGAVIRTVEAFKLIHLGIIKLNRLGLIG